MVIVRFEGLSRCDESEGRTRSARTGRKVNYPGVGTGSVIDYYLRLQRGPNSFDAQGGGNFSRWANS